MKEWFKTFIRVWKILWFGWIHFDASPNQIADFYVKIGAIKKEEHKDCVEFHAKEKIA